MKPLVIELFAGSFGWGAGFVAEGWRSIGFDIVHEPYHGPVPEHCELVLQDVLTLHGSQFQDASAIVASPPCTTYSHMAMPFSRGKKLAKWYREDPERITTLNALFEACFRIQREAIEATGQHCPACYGLGPRHSTNPCPRCNGTCWVTRHIPIVVENVKGAQPWVGRAKWHYGSFYLWGDVPALMPITFRGVMKPGVAHRSNGETNFHGSAARAEAIKNNGGSWFNQAHNRESGLGQNPVNGQKIEVYSDPWRNGGKGSHLTNPSENLRRLEEGLKVPGVQFSGYGTPGYKAQGFNLTAAQRYREEQGTKNGNDWFGSGENCSLQRKANSRSDSRKAASAAIARIPFPLAQHIARVFKP